MADLPSHTDLLVAISRLEGNLALVSQQIADTSAKITRLDGQFQKAEEKTSIRMNRYGDRIKRLEIAAGIIMAVPTAVIAVIAAVKLKILGA